MTSTLLAIVIAAVALSLGCGGSVVGAAPLDEAGSVDSAAADAADATMLDVFSPDSGTADGQADAQVDSAADSPPDGAVDALADSPIDAPPEVSCAPAPPPYDAGAPITVTGTVYSVSGRPLILNVTIQGQTSGTGTDGVFAIAGVTPPYDVEFAYMGTSYTVAYLGLTRPDPWFSLGAIGGTTAGGPSQSVLGTVTAAGVAVDAGQRQFVGTMMDLTGAPYGTLIGNPLGASATFDDFGGWIGAPTAVATLWGFEGNYLSSGGVASFAATGSQTVTLDGGATLTGVDLSISPANFPLTTLSGSLMTPSACNLPTVDLSLGHDLQSGVYFYQDNLPMDASAFAYGTFNSPLVWGLSATCGVPSGSCSVTRSALAGSENLTLTIPAPVTSIAAPSDGAIVPGACADFAWTPEPNSVYLFTVNEAGGTSNYTIVLDRTSFRLPFVLPSGQYTWSVAQIAPVADIDAVTASYAAELILDWRDALADRSMCTLTSTFTVP